MRPVDPGYIEGTVPVIYAKDQPQYLPLPARVTGDGIVNTAWEPTAQEADALAHGARILLETMTFGGPLQPVRLSVLPSGRVGIVRRWAYRLFRRWRAR